MSLDTMFSFLLLLVEVVVAVAVGGAVYIMIANRRTRRETGRRVGSADIPVGVPTSVGPDGDEAAPPGVWSLKIASRGASSTRAWA